eukprot:scaffold67905_cov17-Prasinocladus_malaysianus.AAC.1
MDDLELQHWMRQAVYRAEAKAQQEAEAMLKAFTTNGRKSAEKSFSTFGGAAETGYALSQPGYDRVKQVGLSHNRATQVLYIEGIRA